ncbi:YbbC/YhhH family protein [Hymenobacter sp. BT635]|uniref:YbbC/YhhH family protein n=1 Tax=Hymenobacter nitidus TaxID=2880929 RepID=A0ABS8ACH0_9BACT|nr:NTF2 fold immunity protein [Hymenobacter nitidus]MCB2377986.1 YbbC/YhhH family protein [Hymenobacter nitidus]
MPGRSLTGEAEARARVQYLRQEKSGFSSVLLPDQATAVAVAEPIVFRVYGKANIVRQRPYEVYRIDGFWYISGTLPAGCDGGVFEIILNAKTSEVLKLTHGK